MNTLAEAVREYVSIRRALGYRLRVAEKWLTSFVSFLADRGAAHITSKLAVEWAQLPVNAQPHTWALRLGIVRGFARYRSAADPRTEIPPWGLLPHPSRRARPYRYSDQEIRNLLNAALQLQPSNGLRPWTYYCLFGLLAVTGARLGEILSLRMQDIDFKQGVLTIHRGKFGKSRLVPVHNSTRQILAEYGRRRNWLRDRLATPNFLVSDHGKALDLSTVYHTFYRLSRQIGLRGPSESHGPRLHDFRHQFALKTITSWYRSKQDVEQRLPILSTYLGHVKVTSTYWYLSLCPELMSLSAARLERRWGGQS